MKVIVLMSLKSRHICGRKLGNGTGSMIHVVTLVMKSSMKNRIRNSILQGTHIHISFYINILSMHVTVTYFQKFKNSKIQIEQFDLLLLLLLLL